MQGTILEYNLTNDTGIISSEDSTRYKFKNVEWKSSNITPKVGMTVDFIVKDNIATEIYSIDAPNCATIVSDVSDKSMPIIKTIFKWGIIGGILFFIVVGFIALGDYMDEKEREKERADEVAKVTTQALDMLKEGNLLLSKKQYEQALNYYNGIGKFFDGEYSSYNIRPDLNGKAWEQFVFNRAYTYYKQANYVECAKVLDGFPIDASAGNLNSVTSYILRAACFKNYNVYYEFDKSTRFHYAANAEEDINYACKLGDCDITIPLEQKVENYYVQLNQ
jgi:hypothetical protein